MKVEQELVGRDMINDIPVLIKVASDGTFRIFTENQEGEVRRHIGTGETLLKAKIDARRSIKRESVSIALPFRRTTGEHLVATGIHSTMHRVIVKHEETGQPEYWDWHNRVWKDNTPDEVLKEVIEQGRKVIEARNRIRELEQEWQISLGSTVTAAINDATDASLSVVE